MPATEKRGMSRDVLLSRYGIRVISPLASPPKRAICFVRSWYNMGSY